MHAFYFDLDGVLVNVPEVSAGDFKKLNSSLYVANFPPFQYNVAVVQWLISKGYKVYILSRAIGQNNKKGKMVWIQKYLPTLPVENVILIDTDTKYKYVREPGVLVDDVKGNCNTWRKRNMPTYLLQSPGANIDLKLLLTINQ